MKKLSLLLVFTYYISSNAASVPIDFQQRYDAVVKEGAIRQIDSYVNKTVDLYKQRADFARKIEITPQEAKEQEERVSSTLKQAAEYIKSKAASDPIFFAKIQNAENVSYGQSPFMREIYRELNIPYGPQKENPSLNENMSERLAIMHLLQAMNDDIRSQESFFAGLLGVRVSDVRQPGIKVEEPKPLSRWQKLMNYLGLASKPSVTKSIATPTQQLTTPQSTAVSRSSFWQRFYPASTQKMRERAVKAREIEYKPRESAGKELKQAEFFGTGSYQY